MCTINHIQGKDLVFIKEKGILISRYLSQAKKHWYFRNLSPNLMNLSRVSNPPKNRFQLSTGLNLEALNTILSGTNHF